jgi:hypothetical protein
VYHGASHRTVPDFLSAVAGTGAHDVKASIIGFQFRLGANFRSDPAGGAVCLCKS